VTRLISVRRSAGGDGRRSFSSSFAPTNRSIGFRAQATAIPPGSGGETSASGRSDHQDVSVLASPGARVPPASLPLGDQPQHVTLFGCERIPCFGISGRWLGPGAVTRSSSPLSSGRPRDHVLAGNHVVRRRERNVSFLVAGLVASEALPLEDGATYGGSRSDRLPSPMQRISAGSGAYRRR